MEDASPANSDVLGVRSNRKRTYQQMSRRDGGTSSSTPHFRRSASSSLNQRFPPPPPPLSHSAPRYPGDGLDFRHPIMSTAIPRPDSVIDLTNDSDPVPIRRSTSAPRVRAQTTHAGRSTRATSRLTTEELEVIDLGDEGASGLQEDDTEQVQRRGSSPEVEFLYANRNTSSHSARIHALFGMPSPVEPSSSWSVFANSPFRPFNRPSISQFQNLFSRIAPDLVGAYMPTQRPPPRTQWRPHRHNRGQFRTETGIPTNLNYDETGFLFSPATIPTPGPPRYENPPVPKEGFTRAPQEDEVVVCPNCDHELGSGKDELKRQVWVVRNCGHVYCGECSKFRAKSSRKNADVSVPPFATCVVDDCKTKTNGPKSMFQIYI